MLTRSMLNQKKEMTPAKIESIVPKEFARRQKSPKSVGQKKTASSPPNAKRFIQTKSDGGRIAAMNTSTPTTAVTKKLILLTLSGVMRVFSSFTT